MIDTVGDTQALMDFLQSELQQLEAAVGSEDQEARQLLQQLEQQTAVLQSMSVQADQPVLSDLQLAEQLDNLDLQLSQLEASVAAADAPTLELLGQSTSRWMHADQGAAATAADTHRDAPAALPSDVQSDCQQLHSSSSGMNGCAGAGSRPAVENPSTSSHSLVDDPNTGAKVVSPQPGSSSAAGSSGLSSSPQPSSADGTTTGQQAASAGQEVSFPPSKQQQAANMAALPAQGAGSLPSKA